MFRSTLIAAALLVTGSAHALNTGDLAFTSFNADEDGWSMVTFVNIAANTTIYFTDNEWNGSAIGAGGAFNTGESYHQWNSGASAIAAGTVIRFSAIDVAGLSASVGSLSRATVSGSTNYGISATADTVYAYQGSSASSATTFLTAISTGSFSTAEGSLVNTGLVAGVNAVQLKAASDYAEYAGVRSGQTTFAAYKTLVANAANWNDLGDGSFAGKVPDVTAFAVTAVPEPSSEAMLLAGLGMLGLIARRRMR
ncbi:MAG TPA: PEP-CTERM sorting domain-containing protein [Methyloversatilis sp.]